MNILERTSLTIMMNLYLIAGRMAPQIYIWETVLLCILLYCNGIGGPNDLENESSFFRSTFYPRLIKATSVDAYHDFFIRQDIKIDLLWIDGDHSYEGVKTDFDLYSKILSDNGVIIIHDTDSNYEETLLVSEDAKKDHHSFGGPSKFVKELEENPDWNLINLHNFRILMDKPSSSGVTIINRKK